MTSTKPQTPPPLNKPFYMTLTGQIEREQDIVYLTSPDLTRFRAIGQLAELENLEQGLRQWSVVPNISSEGLIASVQILEIEDDSNQQLGRREGAIALQDSCELTGRVVQLGKRNANVLLKVNRTGEKTLRLTLLNPPPEMKVGQLWQVVARREANYLQIERASRVEEISQAIPEPHQQPSTSTQLQSIPEDLRIKQIGQPDNSKTGSVGNMAKGKQKERIESIAQQALLEATGLNRWVLKSSVQRGQRWEWEAVCRESRYVQRQARVLVNPNTSSAQVYQYPQVEKAIGEASSLSSAAQRLVVTPLGAARSIGASCFRVEIGPYEIVLDAGTRPKGSKPLPAFEYLQNPNLILITHAHQDHIGALPVFHSRFPIARMICTPGTREIAHVMLRDCLKVQQSNEDFEQLFDETDLEQALFRLETQPIDYDFEPLPGLKVRFIHAGHIVGAACVYLRYGERSLLYTGDYNTTSSRTTDGLRLADLPSSDMLITESTYGAATHPSRKAQETELLKAIAEVVEAGGNVLIPAFALGRAQEILLAIRTSPLFHTLKIPVYVDGLVRAVTDVFREHIELLPPSMQNFAKQEEPFFNPDGTPSIIPISHPRERPLAIAKPSVVIASSGMLSGGASVYYAQALLERENAAILISGYTDEESPGRFLQGLQKGDTVEIEGKTLTVRAQVRRFNLSAHADKVGLTQVIHRVQPKHLILIHGSLDALHELARTSDLQNKYPIHIPSVGEAIEFGNLPEQMSHNRVLTLTQPDEFEINIEAEVEGAWLHIPESVLEDPRWQRLAANGLLRAKWTGGGLQLTPLSARHLAIEAATKSGEDCCAVCQFFDKSCCQCPSSPLFTRLVDPRAKCLEFERVTGESRHLMDSLQMQNNLGSFGFDENE